MSSSPLKPKLRNPRNIKPKPKLLQTAALPFTSLPSNPTPTNTNPPPLHINTNTQPMARRSSLPESLTLQFPSEIVFFDVETTVPLRAGAGYSLLEFGAILVCPKRLVEVGSYSTLIRPLNPNLISATSVRCNGITKETVDNAPCFGEVADQVFEIMNERVWAGHNIVRFDCVRIKEAFAEIGRVAPEPKGMVDTLPLLTNKFGRRAGNMKMATLASYFGLGQQKHRSLDDVRMNLEVLKHCAAVLFLETNLPDAFSVNSLIHENTTMRNQDNGNASPVGASMNLNTAANLLTNLCTDDKIILNVCDQAEPDNEVGTSSLMTHLGQMHLDAPQRSATDVERPAQQSPEILVTTVDSLESSSGNAGYLGPDDVSVSCISASRAPHHFGHRILILHRDAPLQLHCPGLRVHFGINSKFLDNAGRPKLNIVVDVPTSLCQILDACDRIAQSSSLDSGSSSEWRPVIMKNGYTNSSSIRLHIPSATNGDSAIHSTEIYKKGSSGGLQKIIFNKLDAAIEQLFAPGTITDTYFHFDTYNYQGFAGIRLVAKRLVVHSM